MSQAPNRAALLQELSRLERPSLARCSSLREQSEERATGLYVVGVEASDESQRELARRNAEDERMVRDYLSGARDVKLRACLTLPREGQLALIRTWLEQLGDERGAA